MTILKPNFPISGAILKSVLDDVADSENARRRINPLTLAKCGGMQRYSARNGLPNSRSKGTNLSAEPDVAMAWLHASFEARKAGPQGCTLALKGSQVVRGPVTVPPVNGVVEGEGWSTGLIYDGPSGKDFFLGGNLHALLTQFPITNVSVSGGQTTVTVGAAPARVKHLHDLGSPATNWTDLSYTNGASEAVVIDAWGQWVGFYDYLGLTDGTKYVRAAVVGIDVDARTVTLATTVPSANGWTPTKLDAPGLKPPGSGDQANVNANVSTDGGATYNLAYSAAGGIHGLQQYDVVRNATLDGKGNGNVRVGYTPGIKGNADPKSIWENVRITDCPTVVLGFDSDSKVTNLKVGGYESFTLYAVDTEISSLQFSASAKRGVLFDGNLSQTFFTGKNKGYYLGQEVTTEEEARSVEFGQSADGIQFPGAFILEDSCGDALYFNHLCNNIQFANIEFNNCGAVGQGAPGTSGKQARDANLVRIARNARVRDISVTGTCRSAYGNRGGSHVKHALYVERPTTLDTTISPPGQERPWLISEIAIDLTYPNSNHSQSYWIDAPDTRNQLWTSGRTNWVNGEICQMVDAPWATRYKVTNAATVNANPTVPPVPATGPTSISETNTWTQPAAGWNVELSLATQRNAWRGAFYEVLNYTGSGATAVVSGAFPEYRNVVILTNGSRDPSYHQRTLIGRSAFTLDPEHDVAKIQVGGLTTTALDVFPGREGKEQIVRLVDPVAGKTVTLQPGFRNNGTTPGRAQTFPAIAGQIATLTRAGAEMRIVHRDGKVHHLPHDQTETLGTIAALTLDLSDYGKTLNVGATKACAVTAPAASSVPEGWYVDLFLTGAGGSISVAGAAGVTALSTQYGRLRLRKIGGMIVGA